MWRTTLAFRGIKDNATLDLLSKLSGHYWAEVRGYSQSANQAKGIDWSHNINYQRQEQADAGAVRTRAPVLA